MKIGWQQRVKGLVIFGGVKRFLCVKDDCMAAPCGYITVKIVALADTCVQVDIGLGLLLHV